MVVKCTSAEPQSIPVYGPHHVTFGLAVPKGPMHDHTVNLQCIRVVDDGNSLLKSMLFFCSVSSLSGMFYFSFRKELDCNTCIVSGLILHS